MALNLRSLNKNQNINKPLSGLNRSSIDTAKQGFMERSTTSALTQARALPVVPESIKQDVARDKLVTERVGLKDLSIESKITAPKLSTGSGLLGTAGLVTPQVKQQVAAEAQAQQQKAKSEQEEVRSKTQQAIKDIESRALTRPVREVDKDSPLGGKIKVARTLEEYQSGLKGGIPSFRPPQQGEPEYQDYIQSVNLRGGTDQAFGLGFIKPLGSGVGKVLETAFDKEQKSPLFEGVRSLEQQEQVAQAVEPKKFTAGKITGSILRSLGAYTAAGSIVNKLGLEGAKGLAGKQGVALLIDTIAQTPFEIVDFVTNDKDASEDVKQFVLNRGIDVAFNLAFAGLEKGAKELVKIYKSGDNGARAIIESQIDVLPQAQKQSIQQELGLPEDLTAQQFLKQQEKFAKDTRIEDYFKQFELTPQQIQDNFNEWRRQNFGGAFGQVSPSDEQALKELYKETTGIDFDVALKEADDIAQQNAKIQQVASQQAPLTEQQVREVLETPSVDEVVQQGLGFQLREPTKAITFDEVVVRSPQYKDLGNFERWTTDVNRNFEKVFGNDIDVVKREILDPFDAAKKARVEDEILLTDALQNDIVKKLGIGKRTKESALVQQFGEGTITLDQLKQQAPDNWQNIVDADKWFRQQYNTLIDDINANRVAIGKDPIPKLDNYYRHFNEMGDTFEGIRNVFESNRQISPQLEGLSEFTRPGERWASFKQRRTGKGKFTEDAVGGFLDYIKAGTYAKHIDPEIPRFRKLHTELSNATEGTKNINNFIGFLNEFANDLSGKTNKFDRAFQDLVPGGRKTFAIINLLNSRMKANAVLGNVSSSLSQIANVPQGVATVKDPRLLAGGLDGYFKSLVGSGDAALYGQSGFLKERLTDSFSKFDTRLIDQPKKFAQWMLGALDETGTKFIWSSVYRKGLADGVTNPIKYADDITRNLVAGRGIGEVPILQKSKLFQLVAPFTLEVNNLWKVQKDFIDKKDFGALAILYGANFLLNEAMEDIRGSRVTFDPIEAIMQGASESEGLGDAMVNIPGRLTGEILGNIPSGQAVAQLVPEFSKGTDIEIPESIRGIVPSPFQTEEGTIQIPSREQIFGETDPTRFGTQLPLVRALQRPVSSLALPFGGQQARKTLEGAEALGLVPEPTPQGLELPSFPSARTSTDRLITPVDPTPTSIAKGLLLGKSAIPELQAYYNEGKPPFGKTQTANFDTLVNAGFDPERLFETLKEAKNFTTKEERVKIIERRYPVDRANQILEVFFGYKTGR